MKRVSYSFLALAVGGSLCGGIGFAQPVISANGQSVQKLDDEHWKYKHMHHAMETLREARKEMDEAEDIFHGHKQDAIDDVDKAIHEVDVGLKEQHDEASLPAELPQPRQLGEDHFPHVRLALERLKDAKAELENADAVFGRHRNEAISHTERAIKQLEDGMHDAGA